MADEKRTYRLKKRAEAMSDTRRRITEAAMELHGTVGPARTTVSAVAERAGVQRHTVYRHFPSEEELFAACSAHFNELHPLPDIEAWRDEPDPAVRLEKALTQLYDHYAETAHMWTNVLRDAELVAALPKTMAPFGRFLDELVALLASGWRARGTRRDLLTAAIGHAVDFRTWESLVQRGGISSSQGARLMRALVEDASVDQTQPLTQLH
ncbi:MAG TPA: helix-turn-helix domain-containing protein [Thermoleophilaceae bacterium]